MTIIIVSISNIRIILLKLNQYVELSQHFIEVPE